MTSSVTVRTLYKRLARDKSKSWTPGTLETYNKRIQSLGDFVNRIASEVAPDDVRQVLALVQQKAAERGGTPGAGKAAARAVGYLLAQMYRAGKRNSGLASNPVDGLKDAPVFKPIGQPSPASPIAREDLPKFWAWLTSHAPPVARDFILLQLFAGLPRKTVADLRVPQVRQEGWLFEIHPIEGRNTAEYTILHPIPDYLVERVLKPRLRTLREGQEFLLEESRGKPLLSVRHYFNRPAFKELVGLKLTDTGIRATAGVVASIASLGETRVAQRLLTIVTAQSIDDLAIEQLRAAQNRAIQRILDMVG